MLIRIFLLIFLALSLLACDSVSGLLGGKPSTSVPRSMSDAVTFWDGCGVKVQTIDDWEGREKEKLESALMDSDRGFLQTGAKGLKLEEEADVKQLS